MLRAKNFGERNTQSIILLTGVQKGIKISMNSSKNSSSFIKDIESINNILGILKETTVSGERIHITNSKYPEGKLLMSTLEMELWAAKQLEKLNKSIRQCEPYIKSLLNKEFEEILNNYKQIIY